MYTFCPESQPHPELHHKKHGQQIEEDDSPTLFNSTLMILHLECCIHVWGPQHKKDVDEGASWVAIQGAIREKGCENDQGPEVPLV